MLFIEKEKKRKREKKKLREAMYDISNYRGKNFLNLNNNDNKPVITWQNS